MSKRTQESIYSLKSYHIAILALFIIFLASAGYFAFPQADDYLNGSLELWGVPGDVYGASVWEAGTSHYFNWSGRYIFNYLYTGIALLCSQAWLYHLTPALLLVFLLSAARWLLSLALGGIHSKIIYFWTLAICVYLLCGMLAVNEVLYFWGGSLQYFIGMILVLLVPCLIIYVFKQNFSPISFLLLITAFFLFMGFNEIASAFFLALCALLVFYNAIYCGKMNIKLLILFLLVSVFFMMTIFAPGNFVRANAENTSFSLFANLDGMMLLSLHKTQQLLVRCLFQTALIPILIFIYCYFPEHNCPQIKNEKFAWLYSFKAGLFIIISVTLFLMFIATVASQSMPSGRVIALIKFIFEAMLISLFIYKLNIIRAGLQRFALLRKLRNIKFNVIFILFALTLCMGQNIYETAVNLANGSFTEYRKTMTAWRTMAQNHPGEDVLLPALTVSPRPVVYGGISSDSAHWENKAFAKYWSLKSVKAEEPASDAN